MIEAEWSVWLSSHADLARGWLTLLFAAIASLGGAAAVLNWRRERGRQMLADEERWFIAIERYDNDRGCYRAEIHYRGQCHLVAIEIGGPRGALLHYPNATHDPQPIGAPVRKIPVDDVMIARNPELATYPLFIVMPARPRWSRSAEVRAEVRVTFEPISASRRRTSRSIATQPMVWAASKPVRTT